MRKPLFCRDVALAVTAGGLAAVVSAFRLPIIEPSSAAQIALLFVGMGAMLFGSVVALMAWAVARTEAALRRGDGVMGRWRIAADAWPGFLALEAKMASVPNALPNDFTLKKGAATKALDVIVGENGLLIGDNVFRLPRHGLPEIRVAGLRMEPGTPVCIELCLYEPPTPSRYGTSPARNAVLRFPVAPTAQHEAARYVTWCHQGRPGEASFFHGRGDGSDTEDLSTCRSCGWQTHKFLSACERCGGSMLSRRWARRLGGVLVVLGLGLAGGLGVLIWNLAPMLLNPGRSFNGSRFSGSPLLGFVVLVLLGSLFAFGAMAATYGAWQVSSGRRSSRVTKVMVSLFLAMLLLAVGMRFVPTA